MSLRRLKLGIIAGTYNVVIPASIVWSSLHDVYITGFVAGVGVWATVEMVKEIDQLIERIKKSPLLSFV